MEPKNQKTIIIVLIMFGYGIAMMVLAIVAFSQFQNMMEDYEYLIQNFQFDPLITITDVRTNICPPGEFSMLLHEFPGTSYGCNCLYASGDINAMSKANITKMVYQGNCTAQQKSFNCTDIPNINRQYLRYTDDNTVPINICYKRLANHSFYKQALMSGQSNCSNNEKFRSCPEGNTNLNTQYCIPKTEAQCPITHLMYGQNNPDPSKYKEEIVINSATIPSYKLYISRTVDRLPISEMRFTEGEKVCRKNDQSNFTPQRKKYNLLLKKENINTCNEFDDRFNKTIVVSEKSYFDINQLSGKLANLPDYDWGKSNYVYSQNFRNYLPWNSQFRDRVKELVDLKDEMKNIKTAQTTVMIINIISCFLISIVLTISEIYNLCGKDVPCIEGEGDQERVRIQRIKKILNYGGKILQCPFVLWAIIVSSVIKVNLRQIADKSPSDNQTNQLLQLLATQVETSIFDKDISMLILFIVVSVIDIILLIYQYFCASQSANKVEPAKPLDVSQQPLNQSHSNNVSQMQPQYNQQPMPVQQQQPTQYQQQPPPHFQQPNMYQPTQTVVVIQTQQQPPMQQPYQGQGGYQQNYGQRY